MKKQIVMGLTFVAMAASASAALAEGTSGCGIGKVVMEGRSGKDANLIASILNQVLIPQSFSQTSGLMGCDTTKAVSNEYQRDTFVASNLDNLSVDIAQGQGDHLSALAGLMGIADKDKAAFYSVAQANYTNLFNSPQTTSKDMLGALNTAMLTNPDLAKYVR
jgi:hypothetical protein